MVQCPSVNKEDVKKTAYKLVRRYVPVITWAPRLNSKFLTDDLIGGFIVGVMIVPTCLSWASLAGIPLSCGLSAALVASFSYGTFGQCGMLSICPVAEITALLISISGIPAGSRETTFQSIGVQVGILSMILSLIDGGKVIKTVFAKAVGDGYTCAAALLAICVQVKVMFNVTAPSATLIQDVIWTTMWALVDQMTIKSVYCFLLFMLYCGYLIGIKRVGLPLWIPHQLIVVVVSILLTWFFRLDESLGLAIVRDIPSALRLPRFPPMRDIIGLGPYTLTVTMISFVQMYVIAQRVMPSIDPNAELFASGITNFLCNVFSGMPVTNSFGCSAVLIQQHVHTPMTAYTAGGVLLISIVFLTRLGVFYYLPKQALAAIVVASVMGLVDFSGVKKLWRHSKKDAAVWILTFLLTIFGGITIGVLSGIMLSLVLVVLRIARPRAVSVGFNMETFRYGDLRKDAELLVYPNILMWRFDAPLYFVNTGYFQEKLIEAIRDEARPIDVVIVTCGKVVDIDSSALSALPIILDAIGNVEKDHPRRIILSEIHGRLEKVLLTSGALTIYVPEEYDRLSIAHIEQSGKFPVVFKDLEGAISFAQRCISERYGNVDTAPYPNVAFLTDFVVHAARVKDSGSPEALTALTSALEEVEGEEQGGGSASATTYANYTIETAGSAAGADDSGFYANNNAGNLLKGLQRLKRISSYTADRELIGVMGVIRHSELTPKQKKKIMITDPRLLRLAFEGIDLRSYSDRRTTDDLAVFFAAVEEALRTGNIDGADSWQRVLAIVHSHPQGLKIQLKPMFDLDASFHDSSMLTGDASPDTINSALLVVKWGGVLTKSGISHAHMLGEKLFARFFAAGDISLRRLIQFTKNPTVFASDESRVVDTALVVVNAITQSHQPIAKQSIRLDDALLKSLTPTTRRMLRTEYRYFEDLMHINTHATARHFFHISGFRELLIIPLLDRPIIDEGDSDLEGTGLALGSEVLANMALRSDDGGAPRARDLSQAFGIRRNIADCDESSATALRVLDYYTPIQVLHDLRRNLDTIANCQLPESLRNMSLSNHESLSELCARYDAMLRNLLGAKRRRRTNCNGVPLDVVESKALSDDGDHDREDDADVSDVSLEPAFSGHIRTTDISETTALAGALQTAFTYSGRSRMHHPATGSDGPYSISATQAPLCSHHPFSSGNTVRYDITDISTLRDYGSYDMAYNYDHLCEIQATTLNPTLRRVLDALQRCAEVTELMARVGESVLEGVNNSKRFIIGSLVSYPILQRIRDDFFDFARMDEWRVLPDLLLRAQNLYMSHRGGVEQDVRNVMSVLKNIGSIGAPSVGSSASLSSAGPGDESASDREMRLRFPFIVLPTESAAASRSREAGDGSRLSGRCQQFAKKGVEDSYTRFYFTSYLHVEGLLQCLSESTTLKGFRRPGKDEMEMSQQMYMKHLIFKVFRRRNVSFTDHEVIEAFRRFHLLFRSEVDYSAQQRKLESDLSALYRSMYYISMEVYLSVGDTEGLPGHHMRPLFTVHSADHPDEMAAAAPGESPRIAEERRREAASAEGTRHFESVLGSRTYSDECIDSTQPRGSAHALSGTASPSSLADGTASKSHSMVMSDAGSGVQQSPHQQQQQLQRRRMHSDMVSRQTEPAVATVMTTPQAGKYSETVQQMQDHMYRVTPMRRVHEGISIVDFERLVLEVESAVQSQSATTPQMVL